ncbi:hypothetical protein [Neobacillus mesonae]|uniref:hypothetical protein n=1 Tax=Neobacillus mesonae TaxID=1193713 RepID=UPI002040AF60|nr:hypothetical protein [Neobacillus mesonae]MCM3569395.1 hypothetical protein [Neobacillus mesonae]
MPTQIAFFGPQAIVEQAQEYTKDMPDILLIPFIYKKPEEVVDHLDQAFYCDVMLFSGLLPYYFAHAQSSLDAYKKPCLYMPINEYMLTISLFQLLYHEGVPLERISIDLPDRSILLQCLNDLNLNPEHVSIIDYPLIFNKELSHFSTSKIVTHHEKLYLEEKVDITLTSIHAVYDALKARGIPCRKMVDPKKNIVESIEEAVVQAKIYQAKQSQMAVGYILLESENLTDNLIQEVIAYFDAEFECSAQYLDDGLFIFYSTRGKVEKATHHFQLFPRQHFLKKKLKLGIGLGLTSKEAKRNAKVALSRTEKYASQNIAFIVTDNETIIGPLGEKENKEYRLNSYDKKVQELAKKVGISVAKFNQFASFVNSLPMNQFTTEDLAENFAVTRRSAERLLKKLIDQHLVVKIGEEQLYEHGRPRSIYTFQLK